MKVIEASLIQTCIEILFPRNIAVVPRVFVKHADNKTYYHFLVAKSKVMNYRINGPAHIRN